MRHWVYTAARIVLYEDLRDRLAGDAAPTLPVMMAVRGARPVAAAIAHDARCVQAGFTAGALGQFIASPADLVKVRLQSGAKEYSGFTQTVRRVYAVEGARGFYTGWRSAPAPPSVPRARSRPALQAECGPGCDGQSGRAGDVRRLEAVGASAHRNPGRYREGAAAPSWPPLTAAAGLSVHVLSALTSGFFAALCSTPADVCKSRVMSGMYPSMTACLVGTVRTEGAQALFKGFMPNWLRLGPWQFCFWVAYENLRIKVTGTGF